MKEEMTDWDLPVQRGTARAQQAQGLLDLASELQGLLAPVRPAAAARKRMHDDLVKEARRYNPGRARLLFQQYRRAILIAAAAVGSLVSIAGVIAAIVQRSRHVRSTHAA